VIANLGVYFAVHALFSGTVDVDRGPLHLELPDPTTLRPVPLAVAVVAAALLFRLRWSVLRTLGVAALLGLVAGLAGLPVRLRPMSPGGTGGRMSTRRGGRP
jgi:chromate transporter